MGKRRQGRWQAAAAGAGGGSSRRKEERGRRKGNTNLDNLVLKLMAIVGSCGTLTALRGPASTIKSVSDINNNT